MKISRSGFTIVELLIVITVIAILATVMMVTYEGNQSRARDTKRQQDLHSISEAIQLYRQKNGNDIQVGSGCGSSGNGNGWFNYAGGTYPGSMLSCLTDAGYLDGGGNFVDPSGCTTTTGSSAGSPVGYCHKINGAYGYAYMKYSKGTGDASVTCLYARLENGGNPNAVISSRTQCGGPANIVSSYNMNYVQIVN